jgi:hypothetical protein
MRVLLVPADSLELNTIPQGKILVDMHCFGKSPYCTEYSKP